MLTRLMDCKHHHITMTLPKAYRGLSKMNKDILHDILFKASAFVINQWFEQKYNLRVGSVLVLHTSGADLKYHPHIHMITSRGGQDLTTNLFRFIEGDFLCKNEVLGKLLKDKFNQLLINKYIKGELKVFKNINSLSDLKKWINKLDLKHWIVNIEKPLEDINQIIGYVGRYTKRACISEYKIEQVDKDIIKFKFNDYKNTPRGEKPKVAIIAMKPFEFLDQLLQHVPTKRYKMVRYSGLYNSHYLNKIPTHLKLKSVPKEQINWDLIYGPDYDWGDFEQFRKAVIRAGKPDPFICQHCNQLKIFLDVQFPQKSKKNNPKIFNDSS